MQTTISTMPAIWIKEMCSFQITAPDMVGIIVERDAITAVYDQGPIFIAFMEKIRWIVVIPPKARPKMNVNQDMRKLQFHMIKMITDIAADTVLKK